jgi:hypothetical protein
MTAPLAAIALALRSPTLQASQPEGLHLRLLP